MIWIRPRLIINNFLFPLNPNKTPLSLLKTSIETQPSPSVILSLFVLHFLWLFYHFLKAYNDSFLKQNLGIKQNVSTSPVGCTHLFTLGNGKQPLIFQISKFDHSQDQSDDPRTCAKFLVNVTLINDRTKRRIKALNKN